MLGRDTLTMQHKRLRERIWILPIPAAPEPVLKPAIALPPARSLALSTDPSPLSPTSPAVGSRPSLPVRPGETAALALEAELQQLLDLPALTTSELSELAVHV